MYTKKEETAMAPAVRALRVSKPVEMTRRGLSDGGPGSPAQRQIAGPAAARADPSGTGAATRVCIRSGT